MSSPTSKNPADWCIVGSTRRQVSVLPESEYLRGCVTAPRLIIMRGIAATHADDISIELMLLRSNFIPGEGQKTMQVTS